MLATMTQRSNRRLSNYRYYCDNDPQGENTRWQLREDPQSIPFGYIPQRLRSRTAPQPNQDNAGYQFQEWYDPRNGIEMGRLIPGCNAADVVGVTYTQHGTYGRQPYLGLPTRATITVCGSNMREDGTDPILDL